MLKLIFVLMLRSIWVMIVTCIQLFLGVVNFQANMCWKLILWTVNITTLPVRALGALQREKTIGRLLDEMQSELEDLSWRNEKLEARLKMAVKERHLMDSMLAEIEEEHDMAIGKIERLEREVEYLKKENFRLKESHTKGFWDTAHKSSAVDEPITASGYRLYGTPWDKNGNTSLLQDLQTRVNPLADEKRAMTGLHPTGLVDPFTPLVFSSSVDADAALDQRREVALFQSLFSALLSLLVGAVIWEAKDPCMPLVMALFSVVGLSLRSVVQFFSTIKNRPASDAVALLSFNWFILGTLAYPSLPGVARMLSPVAVAFMGPILRGLGISSSG